jgi:hypothetical protein
MPGRARPKSNEDWTKAVDDLEAELKSCSIQVLRCISIQNINGGDKQQPSPLKIKIETAPVKKPVTVKPSPLK